MNHEHYQQLVSEFIDREIQAGDEQDLFTHLNSCSECREFLKASCRLQVEMAGTKAKEPSSPVKSLRPYVADREPAPQMYRSPRSRSPISTFVLLAMVTLIVAVLFSANVKVERSGEVASQELIQPK
jgi:predicted anti-sigma-YlaC factor YlaD